MSFHYELSYTMIRCFWISIALDIYIYKHVHIRTQILRILYICCARFSRSITLFCLYIGAPRKFSNIYRAIVRWKMDKWINEKEKKKNASWLETVKNTLKLILLSVYGNVLMIDPVKKSRKHNARAICIYLKKKKNIYIFVKDQSYMEFFPRCISKIYWKDWMYWEIV